MGPGYGSPEDSNHPAGPGRERCGPWHGSGAGFPYAAIQRPAIPGVWEVTATLDGTSRSVGWASVRAKRPLLSTAAGRLIQRDQVMEMRACDPTQPVNDRKKCRI